MRVEEMVRSLNESLKATTDALEDITGAEVDQHTCASWHAKVALVEMKLDLMPYGVVRQVLPMYERMKKALDALKPVAA